MSEKSSEKDFFDRMMSLPFLSLFQPFYSKHKEALLYLLFGGLSFVLSVVLFVLFNSTFGMNELSANAVSWFLTVLFVYITNKLWVFKVVLSTKVQFLFQIVKFYISRIGTLLLEEVLLFVFITKLSLPGIPVKLFAQLMVIIVNFVFSKLFVFNGDKK